VTAVACVGDCCLDVYLEPVGRVLVGGSCLNVAVGLARHGVAAAYAGPVGDDDAAGRVLALLGAHGVDAAHVRRVPGARTAVTDILLEPGGERRFLREDYAIQEAYAPSEAEWAWLAGMPAVHSSRMPVQLARLRTLARGGTRVSYDFTTDPLPGDLGGLDVAFVPDEALGDDDSADAAHALVARGAACAVVTQGERGAVAATAAGLERVAAVPAGRVVDTCGAGDAFMAGFLARRIAGAPLAECLAAGAADGAAACAHLGAVDQAGT
jgi:fructoselysine 6-kinase